VPIVLKANDHLTWNKADYSVCNISKDTIYLRSKAGDPVKFPRDLFCRLVQEKEIVIPEGVTQSREEIAQELAGLFRAMNSANHVSNRAAAGVF
jgi:hypothetical protein